MNKKILLVDDDPEHLELLKHCLSQTNSSFVACSSGQEALDSIPKENPDLIIMDVMMPAPDGYTTCRTLKADPLLKKIPVILLTAKSATSDRFEGWSCGADAYLTKPFETKELLDTIQSLLS